MTDILTGKFASTPSLPVAGVRARYANQAEFIVTRSRASWDVLEGGGFWSPSWQRLRVSAAGIPQRRWATMLRRIYAFPEWDSFPFESLRTSDGLMVVPPPSPRFPHFPGRVEERFLEGATMKTGRMPRERSSGP